MSRGCLFQKRVGWSKCCAAPVEVHAVGEQTLDLSTQASAHVRMCARFFEAQCIVRTWYRQQTLCRCQHVEGAHMQSWSMRSARHGRVLFCLVNAGIGQQRRFGKGSWPARMRLAVEASVQSP